jgi:glycosyltransferase involved in cell wall biosynthesis
MPHRQPPSRKPIQVALLDEHPSPFRIPLFRHLGTRLPGCTVLFTHAGFPDRRWSLPSDLGFPHRILPSKLITLRKQIEGEKRYIPINPTLWGELLALSPDVIVGYAFSVPAWNAHAYARARGKGFVCWYEGTARTEIGLSWIQRWIRRVVVAGADACVTPSRRGRETLLSHGADPARIWTIPLAGDIAPGSNGEARRSQGGPMSILYVGALSRIKGVEHLLQAMPRIAREHPDARLRIVGAGPCREELQGLARRLGEVAHVSFQGFVQPEALAAHYREARLFAFPSLGDTYGAVVGEAVRAGVPVVVSRHVGSATELLEEGGNGYVVDPAEPGGIADAILRILTDPQREARMRQRSREIGEMHSPQRAATRFAEAIEHAWLRCSR